MATALFIKREDLVRNSILDGNVDTDKFIQFIKIAQDIHVENYLGTQLITKLKDLVLSGDIDDPQFSNYKDLLELQDHFEAQGKSFYMSEVKYGLSDNEYMYQVHIVK